MRMPSSCLPPFSHSLLQERAGAGDVTPAFDPICRAAPPPQHVDETARMMIEPDQDLLPEDADIHEIEAVAQKPMMSTPAKTPSTVPRPPKKLAPPMMTAAIASSSAPMPAFG